MPVGVFGPSAGCASARLVYTRTRVIINTHGMYARVSTLRKFKCFKHAHASNIIAWNSSSGSY